MSRSMRTCRLGDTTGTRPSVVQQAKFSPTSGYHLTMLTLNYLSGPVFQQFPSEPTRRWDLDRTPEGE